MNKFRGAGNALGKVIAICTVMRFKPRTRLRDKHYVHTSKLADLIVLYFYTERVVEFGSD